MTLPFSLIGLVLIAFFNAGVIVMQIKIQAAYYKRTLT